MLTLVLTLAAIATDTTHLRDPAPQQDAPAIIVHRQPALPVVALRLSILASDPPGFAGAGHLFQHLLLPSLEDQVARVGGRVSAVRGSDAIVYQVVGPASELDYLAGVLRGALRAPTPGSAEMLSALSALGDERAAERETAPRYVRSALRAALFPSDLPAAGTPDAATRLETARLVDLWDEIYRPGRVQIIAVGDVDLGSVRRAFRTLPPAAGGGSLPVIADTVAALEADTPQATRGWLGSAWNASDLDPAAVSVTARLLRSSLRRRMTRSQVEVEHWWTHQGQAVVLVVATPDSLIPSARRTVGGALASLSTSLNDAAARDAAAAVRRDLLFYARTPERMAELLGGFADRGAGSEAAQDYLTALDAVGEAEVRAVLERLQEQTAASVFVPPQRIPAAQRR
jgi:predicted Zn-dependent peptidase